MALALLAAAGPCQAAIRVSFYSHGWGLSGGGFLYFPHAFVVIERGPDDPPGPARESFGFTAASPNAVMLTGRSAGRIMEQDARYAAAARLHFTLAVTQAQYLALIQAVEDWRAADHNRYALHGRNCVSFVAALARALGLATPDAPGLDPSAFLEGVRRANLDRLTSPDGADIPVNEAPAYP